MPKYSIITVASNGLTHTIKCVESIIACTKDFELIVVDNNSDDGTEAWLDLLISKHQNVKVARSPKNLTFAENNNCGLLLVDKDSEFIVFLNNDTIVSPDWLDRMAEHFRNIPMKNLGAIGPVSSSSNGRQMVGKQDPEQWYQQYRSHWKHAGILYGWCIMVKKSIIDKIGGFDERFVNSWEDNDLCLRIQEAGYSMAVAYDVYIDHVGQGTLSKMWDVDAYMKNGAKMRKVFFDKYEDDQPKKLVAVYRTNAGAWLERSLEQTSKFADSIVLHFCRAPKEFPYYRPLSNDPLGRMVSDKFDREGYESFLKQAYPKIVHIEWYDGIFQEDYERGRLLEIALQMQARGEADWCISVDDDELYEDKFIDRVQALMRPRNPQILGYWCNWRTIWDTRLGVEYYRSDSTFGAFANYRFFKLIQGQTIMSKHPEGHHCGSSPWIADENLQWTNVRVKHMGYDTPEQRQKKFEFYQANDNFKNRADIGFDDYSHLIDLNPMLVEYKSGHGISLNCMFKNDERWIEEMMENMQYLVDEFVMIDTGSTDGSRAIVEEFARHSPVPVKVLDFAWADNYSLPRNFAKSHSTKPYIMFMDTDERFKPEHVRQIWADSEADHDIVMFNVLNYMEPPQANRQTRVAPTQAARLFRNIPEFYFTGLVHETIDDSSVAYRMSHKVKGMVSAVELHHYGWCEDENRRRGKLEYYEMLNKRQIEITEGRDCRCHFNLALHYIQDDKFEDALRAFQESLKISPQMWHASQQMAMLNLNNAKTFLGDALRYMPQTHPSHNKMVELFRFLERECHGFVKVS